MKNISIKIISLLVLITMTLSSCLNDLEDFMGQFSGSPAIAELSEAANPSTGTIVREIINPTVPAEFTLRVNIASANYFKTDSKITLAIDNALVTAYNTAKGLTGAAAAVPIPAAALTVSSYDVIIPAGTREIDWTFSINATLVPNPTSTFYILPVKITAADNGIVISGNYAEKLIRILARNKYDGKYTVTGTFTDYVNGPPWTGLYPKHVNLITLGGDLVSKYDTDNSTYAYYFDTGAGLSQFGNFTPTFKFSTTTDNVIDVINSTFDAAPRSRTAALYTGLVPPANANKFFTSDHHIEVSYYLVQQNVLPVNRTLIIETYTYVGPR
jgi:hypothetical protein